MNTDVTLLRKISPRDLCQPDEVRGIRNLLQELPNLLESSHGSKYLQLAHKAKRSFAMVALWYEISSISQIATDEAKLASLQILLSSLGAMADQNAEYSRPELQVKMKKCIEKIKDVLPEDDALMRKASATFQLLGVED